MKIHPLFEKVVVGHAGTIGRYIDNDELKAWIDAGKPVVEEEKVPALLIDSHAFVMGWNAAIEEAAKIFDCGWDADGTVYQRFAKGIAERIRGLKK